MVNNIIYEHDEFELELNRMKQHEIKKNALLDHMRNDPLWIKARKKLIERKSHPTSQ